jgi:STE24 endopeptidase
MWIFAILLLIQYIISTTLSVLNLANLRRNAINPPVNEWMERLDLSQFPRMVAYTTAKTRLEYISGFVSLFVSLVILFSGLLPALTCWTVSLSVSSVWQGLLWLAVLGLISYLTSVPFDLASSFGVEKKFGFSTITVKIWLLDQVKSLLLSIILSGALMSVLLWLIEWLGFWWWLPAWIFFSLFQLLMMYIAPVLILPLFNKFEPLQDEELGDKILELARRAAFPLSGVYQIDASLRSTHSNAYFTGIGKTRRIALFDTLIAQHTHEELLAVLAHEIGHWKKRHVLKTLAASILLSAGAMALIAVLLDTPWLYESVGVNDIYTHIGVTGSVAAVGLFMVGLLLSPLGLILSPIANWFSRRNEYEADAYALSLYNHPTALIDGLVKLSEKNLSNLFPHPLVVVFRYSHPPLFARVTAIRARAIATPTE